MAESTVRSVKNVITRLCNISHRGMYVKRKDRVSAATNKSVWWYIVRADEEILCDLETKWEPIQLQLNWKLEHCFMRKEAVPSVSVHDASQLSQPVPAPQAQSPLNTDGMQMQSEPGDRLQEQSQVHQAESQNMDTMHSASAQNTQDVTVIEDPFLVKDVVSPVLQEKLT